MRTPAARETDGSVSRARFPAPRRFAVAVFLLPVFAALLFAGCVHPAFPQRDREERILQALDAQDGNPPPPSPLSPEQAVSYALRHNLDSRVAQLEAAYQNETLAAARRRLLPSLTARHAFEHTSRPAARWSQGIATGQESLESSFSSERDTGRSEVGLLWNILDFGVGYLKARQQSERVQSAFLQHERVRQQVALETLSQYWRAAFAASVAAEADALRRELESHAESIRDSVDMRILSGAEGARRELAVYNGLAELEQWRRAATQSKLELARVLGCGGALDFRLRPFPEEPPGLPAVAERNPEALQRAALRRRPELHQADAQERIALDDARMALLQIAPNASLSFNLHNDPDKFLEYNNWMTVGARVSWNLFSIPARLSERRAARMQGEVARQKGLALAAAVMAQVGIAWSDWRLSHEHAASLHRRAGARRRLVEALAAGEEGGQSSAEEVLYERVRLLSERAAAMRAGAEAMIAGARLANAVGVAIDDGGCFVWRLSPAGDAGGEEEAARLFPGSAGGVPVARAKVFITREAYAPADSGGTERDARSPAERADAEAEKMRAGAALRQIARDIENEGREREDAARRERERRRERLLRGGE